jgi:hypothetical protein
VNALVRGALAGVAGTVAMDLLWYKRYRDGGGDSPFAAWERTGAIESWDDAPAPAQMARKLLQLIGHDVPVERAGAVNNVMHWGYGVGWATAYGIVAAHRRRWWQGPAFGALVWASDYVTLPLAGVYQPIWEYDLPTLWQDLSAHLVFGTAADAAFRLLPSG